MQKLAVGFLGIGGGGVGMEGDGGEGEADGGVFGEGFVRAWLMGIAGSDIM